MDQTTETIMREFREYVQKLIDHVATLSTQAQQVEGLRQQVESLTSRVSQLEQENSELRRNHSEATDHIGVIEARLNDTNHMLEVERGITQSLRDTIVQRDNAVVELNSKVEHEASDHRVTKADLEDARRNIEEKGQQIVDLNQRLVDMTDDRDRYRAEAHTLREQNGELKTRLDRITSILNPPQPVSSDVQSQSA